jgi:hypothetical protein
MFMTSVIVRLRLSALVLGALVLAVPARAHAEPIRDGSAFELEPKGVTLCIVEPAARRSQVGCEGLESDLKTRLPASPSEGRVVLTAIARSGDQAEAPWAVLSIFEVKTETQTPAFEATDVRAFADAIREAEAGTLPAGARARPIVGSLVDSASGKVFRGQMDVDGIPDDAPTAQTAMQHIVTYLVPVESKRAYVVTWSAKRAYATTFDPIAATAITTAHVAEPARPRGWTGHKVAGYVLTFIGLASLLTAMHLLLWKWGEKRKQAVYGHPPHPSPPTSSTSEPGR